MGANPGDPTHSSQAQVLNATGDLLRERAADLFLLSYAIIDNLGLAQQAIRTIIERGFERARQTRRVPDPGWLYQQCLKESRSLARHAPINELKPSGEVDSRLWRLLAAFDERERLLCAAHFVLGWGVEDCARLLNVSASAIRAQLSIFARKFEESLTDLTEAQSQIGDSLKRRFEPADWSSAKLDEWIEQARTHAFSTAEAVPNRVPALLSVLAGLLVLLAVLIVGGGIVFFGSNLSAAPQVTQPPTRLTPTVQIRQALPLIWLSSPEDVHKRLHESSQFWRTLWIDVQTNHYGPAGYLGAPRIYRSQAWIARPEQSIELFGLHSKPPTSSHTYSEGRSTYINPLLDLTIVREAVPSPSMLIYNEQLRQMVFPGESRWMLRSGTFQPYDTDRIIGIGTLVVDWYNEFGQREARLWIDSRTGLILRSQIFGGVDYSLLISDSIVTEIEYDQNFPPSRLSTEMRSVGTNLPDDPSSANQIIQPTPTPALEVAKRQSPAYEAVPSGFDPASSQLTFQFSNNLDAANVLTDTARTPVVLIADGYHLSESSFGLPWMLRCERSPNSYFLAFNTGSDGTSYPDASLRWLDLRDSARVYEPAPDLAVQSFSFAPDSRRVAAFAHSNTTGTTGIYLIDLILGEQKLVIPLFEANSLVWSPDSESLAFVGRLIDGDPLEVFVIHVRTGQVSFQAALPDQLAMLPPEWPISNWGLTFPREMGGLGTCANPPAP